MNSETINNGPKKKKKQLKKLTLNKSKKKDLRQSKPEPIHSVSNISETDSVKKYATQMTSSKQIKSIQSINQKDSIPSLPGMYNQLSSIQKKSQFPINLKPIPENEDQEREVVNDLYRKIQLSTKKSVRGPESYNPYTIGKTPHTNRSKRQSSIKGMSSKLAPKSMQEVDDGISQADIRKLIESKYDIGREIENLVRPVDEDQAHRICSNEANFTLVKGEKFSDLYVKNSVWRRFGEGMYFYFSFMSWSSLLFLLVAILACVVLVLNVYKGPVISKEQEITVVKTKFPTFLSFMTFGNLPNGSDINFEKVKSQVLKFEKENEKQMEVLLDEENQEGIIVVREGSQHDQEIQDMDLKLKKAIQSEVESQRNGDIDFLKKRFTIYLWIDFAISLILLVSILLFQIWVRKNRREVQAPLTIQDFAVEIGGLQDIRLETEEPTKFLYQNGNFWKGRVRLEPHSVNTFYVKNRSKNYFFGKEIGSNHTYNPLSISKIGTSFNQSKTTLDKNGSICQIPVNSSMFKFSESIKKQSLSNSRGEWKPKQTSEEENPQKSVPKSVEQEKLKKNNNFFPTSIIDHTKQKKEDVDFAKLREIGEKSPTVENFTKYFKIYWGVDIKSVKFVYDFKGTLPDFIKISESSYKLAKLFDHENR